MSDASRLTMCLDLDETILYTEISEAGPQYFKETSAGAARQFAQDRRISVGRPCDFEIELPYLEKPIQVYKRPELDDFMDEVATT